MGVLTAKNAIVTGASRGLGAMIARAMWREGANLLLVARSADALINVAGELRCSGASGQRVETLAVDLCAEDAVPRILAAARARWQTVEVLVNNAAIQGPVGVAWENEWNAWEATLRVNLLAPIQLCRACVRWMGESNRGKIVNVSGGGATSARPNFSAYATAKVGLVRFSEILAQETRPLNIQVNCVAPGVMNTEMLQAIVRAGPDRAGAAEYRQATQPPESADATLRRAAELCVFLGSPASDAITGKLISAVWDPWERLPEHADELTGSDLYTLRRITPRDRGADWG